MPQGTAAWSLSSVHNLRQAMSTSGKFLQHSWAGKLVPGPLADVICGGTQGTGPRLKCGSHNLGLQLAAEMKKIGRGICLFVCPVLLF